MDGAMFDQREQRPDPDTALRFRALAESLSQFLERELVSLEDRKHPADYLKAVYDSVYLSVSTDLADGLVGCEFSDLELLREPLCATLASTQVSIVLELLYLVMEMLDDEYGGPH
jgi:hypothetical protein